MIYKIENPEEKKQIASAILNQLPEWFGLPNSTAAYIKSSAAMPFWAERDHGETRGFIALKETSPSTAEVYVMGVLKDCHHCGIGTALFLALHQYAKTHGYDYLQVKTVQKGHYKEYDITNAFYESQGFKALECFPTMWDPCNPCQIYVRSV